mmetsp:Transcript_9586/g.30483  ORF Transcript_9586/g.30483 Transcript_9586/m.30483 type:complete len:327 (+) Transcript_9586:270-1250(+)
MPRGARRSAAMVPRSRISSATPPSYCSISALSRLQQRLWLWACVSRACWSAPGASGASARRGVSGAALEDPALHHEGAKLWPPAQRLVAVGGVRPSAAARAELETLVQVEARVQRRARRASAARPRAKRDATGRAVDKVAVGPRPREDPQPRVRREEEALARAKVLRRVCAPRLGSKAAKDAAVRVEHHEQRGAARGEAAVEGLQRAAVLVGREGQPPVVLPQPNRQRGAQRAQRCEREHRMQLGRRAKQRRWDCGARDRGARRPAPRRSRRCHLCRECITFGLRAPALEQPRPERRRGGCDVQPHVAQQTACMARVDEAKIALLL